MAPPTGRILTSRCKIKKGKSNIQSDASSILNNSSETIRHVDVDDKPAFLKYETNLELELNRSLDEIDFIDMEKSGEDKLFAKMVDTKPLSINFDPIGVEDALQAQPKDAFCTKLR